jgi:hypothetical protein
VNLHKKSAISPTLASGWLRENPGSRLTPRTLQTLERIKPPALGTRGDILLTNLAKRFPKPGVYIRILDNRGDSAGIALDELLGYSYSEGPADLLYLLSEYLVQEKKFVERCEDSTAWQCCRIKPAGWAHLDSLSRQHPDSQQGFIAMWFDDSVRRAWLAIEDGIRLAGYRPLRIDQKHHNNEITDEIIAAIRKSKFLVADLTEHRNGVYFEAGLAKGLGLEVIWLCRDDQHAKAHFDVRQYNCILWKDSDLPALTKALKDRIEATLGRGPLALTASA